MTSFTTFRKHVSQRNGNGSLPGGMVFDSALPITIASAPGRLDVMGGVADYSGSLVAEATIGETVRVALQRRADSLVRVSSRDAEREGHAPLVEVDLAEIGEGKYGAEGVRKRLSGDPKGRWAAYVVGVLLILLAEKYVALPLGGADVYVESDVPIGGGVSSSAAVEVAAMVAFNAAYGAGVPSGEIGPLAQRVENVIVGAPCGIMDQMAVAHGRVRALMKLLCRPSEITGYQPLPDGVRVFGINSAVKHSVAGSPYTKARIGAFMGRRIINHKLAEAGDDHAPVAYLCEVTPSRYRRDFADLMPASIGGAEFLSWLGETGDAATVIDPSARYSVRAATEHPIYENQRVQRFLEHLGDASRVHGHAARALSLVRAGELMYASHWSYTRINLGARETNLIVKLAREMGPARGIFGAKITGGGSGGTVALLTDGDGAAQCVAEIAQRYADATGLAPQIVEGGASPGALHMGAQTAPAG